MDEDVKKYVEKGYESTGDGKMFVQYVVTNYCNLNCPFCINDSFAGNNEFMTYNTFKSITDKLDNEIALLQISGGEPFANKDIVQMIRYLIDKQITFHLNTNGTLLKEEALDLLMSYPNCSLQISLDGVDRETDDYFRGPGHYDKVLQIMSKMREKGGRNGIIKMVINKLNYDQIDDYFYLALQYGFMPTYGYLMKSGRAKVTWQELCVGDRGKREARLKIIDLIDKNKDYINYYKSKKMFVYLKYMNIRCIDECRFSKKIFDFAPLILYDGTSFPCAGLFQKEYCIGNVLKQTPEKIFSMDNPLVKDLNEKAMQRREKLENTECKDCFLNFRCGKGCLMDAQNNGNFLGPPSDCGLRKLDFIESMLKKR